MNPDTLAFLNRQLAALLIEGVPLEGALRQAAADLRGPLKGELLALESELAQGVPLTEAIERRKLPRIYTRIVRTGIAGGKLPAALIAAANHFEESARLRRNVQSALFYPVLILFVGLGVSWIAIQINARATATFSDFAGDLGRLPMGNFAQNLNHALLGFFAFALGILIFPPTRRWLGSRLPGFKDARLAQIAQSFHLLLQSGCPLPESIRLVRELETNSPAASELARWETRIAGGITRLAEVSRPDAQHPSKAIPPFFRWLVLSTGDRVADGFARAAAHYSERARHRMDILVTGLAPGAVLALGFLIVLNFLPAFLGLVTLIDQLGGGE